MCVLKHLNNGNGIPTRSPLEMTIDMQVKRIHTNKTTAENCGAFFPVLHTSVCFVLSPRMQTDLRW